MRGTLSGVERKFLSPGKTSDPRESGRNDPRAADELLPLVYGELRSLARARMASEPAGQTLEPTGLVHEAYLRLLRSKQLDFRDRAYFFAAAAQAMQRILVERARRYAAAKHGGRQQRVTFDPERLATASEVKAEEILALDEALGRLDQLDEDMAQVVRLRFFAGMTVAETTELVGRSRRTVERQWTAARAWLHRELTSGTDS